MTSCLKNKTMRTACRFWLMALVVTVFTIMNFSTSFAGVTVSVFRGQAFNTPQDAVDALVTATREFDKAKAMIILGPDAEAIIFSGNKVEGRKVATNFVEKYDEKHHLEMASPTSATLTIGKDDWPFPIPIVKVYKSWLFNVAAGKEEISNRRIGKNELSVIQVMQTYVEAQLEYASKDRDGDGVHEFAQQLKSDKGKKNGLYWPVQAGEELSPLGAFIAEASSKGHGSGSPDSQPYQGYYYKLITRQGKMAPGGAYDYVVNGNMILGFGLIAYPAKYGVSGIMTFAVNQEGVVHEVDLGEKTADIVNKRTKYNLKKSWCKVCDQDLNCN